ncbi:MAG: DNA polymerase III subunit [Peptococcaceae bacterium]|nr:DNA polymerase III subunit [Peptococcaceae bacterium]
MSGMGNAVGYFWEAVRKGQVAHFYLFYGETGRHRQQALALAATLNCLSDDRHIDVTRRSQTEPLFCGECTACRKIFSGHHPDVEVIGPAKSSIGIDQVVSLQKKVSRKPYEGLFQVYMIEEAEKLSLPAANALLVTTEEPSAQTVLILSCSSDVAVLPTLRSRARIVYFPPEDDWGHDDEDTGSKAGSDWGEALRLCGGNGVLAREAARVGVTVLQDLTDKYETAVMANDFLRLFNLFPIEREVALVWLQVMAARMLDGRLDGMLDERLDGRENAHLGAQFGARIVAHISEAIRALQRQADVRLTVEVLALKHMRGA